MAFKKKIRVFYLYTLTAFLTRFIVHSLEEVLTIVSAFKQKKKLPHLKLPNKPRMSRKKRGGNSSLYHDGKRPRDLEQDGMNNHSPLPLAITTLNKSPSSSSSSKKGDLAKYRKHLFGKHVLRNNCILVSGLSKQQAQDYFARFGKICQVLERPKGVSSKGKSTSSAAKVDSTSDILVKFMTERSASIAVRDTSSQAHFAYIPSVPYCEKFLNGDNCRDLQCIHLHEDVSALSPKSQSSAARTFKAAFRTTPTILRKEKSASSSSTECWSNVKTKSFLEATMGGQKGKSNERICSGECVESPPETKEDNLFQDDFSCSHVTDNSDDDDDETRSGAFQLIVTPDSTLTKSTYSSRMTGGTTITTVNTSHNSEHSIGTQKEDRFVEVVGLPAKQLFVKDSRVISPPGPPGNSRQTHSEAIKMCTSPWQFGAPFSYGNKFTRNDVTPRSNGCNVKSDSNLARPSTASSTGMNHLRHQSTNNLARPSTASSTGMNHMRHQSNIKAPRQRIQYSRSTATFPMGNGNQRSQYCPQLPQFCYGYHSMQLPSYCPPVRYMSVPNGYHHGQQYAYYQYQQSHPYG